MHQEEFEQLQDKVSDQQELIHGLQGQIDLLTIRLETGKDAAGAEIEQIRRRIEEHVRYTGEGVEDDPQTIGYWARQTGLYHPHHLQHLNAKFVAGWKQADVDINAESPER